jgi:hypothetical protein
VLVAALGWTHALAQPAATPSNGSEAMPLSVRRIGCTGRKGRRRLLTAQEDVNSRKARRGERRPNCGRADATTRAGGREAPPKPLNLRLEVSLALLLQRDRPFSRVLGVFLRLCGGGAGCGPFVVASRNPVRPGVLGCQHLKCRHLFEEVLPGFADQLRGRLGGRAGRASSKRRRSPPGRGTNDNLST